MDHSPTSGYRAAPWSSGGSYRGCGWSRDEWGRDESSGPKVATASAGPTECQGSDTPADRRRQTWGLPEARLPGKETRLASDVFAEAQDKDVIPDRRDVPWSPENVLIDTVARLQRDLNDMRAESRYLRTPGVRDALPPFRM